MTYDAGRMLGEPTLRNQRQPSEFDERREAQELLSLERLLNGLASQPEPLSLLAAGTGKQDCC